MRQLRGLEKVILKVCAFVLLIYNLFNYIQCFLGVFSGVLIFKFLWKIEASKANMFCTFSPAKSPAGDS